MVKSLAYATHALWRNMRSGEGQVEGLDGNIPSRVLLLEQGVLFVLCTRARVGKVVSFLDRGNGELEDVDRRSRKKATTRQDG